MATYEILLEAPPPEALDEGPPPQALVRRRELESTYTSRAPATISATSEIEKLLAPPSAPDAPPPPGVNVAPSCPARDPACNLDAWGATSTGPRGAIGLGAQLAGGAGAALGYLLSTKSESGEVGSFAVTPGVLLYKKEM